MAGKEKSNRVSLTDLWLRRKKIEEGRVEFWDRDFQGGSFGVRVSANGTKTFVLMYRNAEGRLRRLSIGRFPALSVKQARNLARTRILEVIAENRDPQEEKTQRRVGETFREVVEDYLNNYAVRKRDGGKKDRKMAEVFLLPAFGPRKMVSIRRREVRDLLLEIATRPGGKANRARPVLANRLKSLLSKIFNYAVDELEVEGLDFSPIMRLGQPGGKEKGLDRHLAPPELRKFWEALEKEAEPMASLYRIILLTGQRPGEIKQMRWDEINDRAWEMPAPLAKNGDSHVVPFSSQALRVLEQLKPVSGDREYVFSSFDGSYFKWFSKATQRIAEAAKIEFTPRDLRRTAITEMARLGVSKEIRQRVLNHRLRDVEEVHYNKYDYFREKRLAMERWGAKLEQIISGRKAKVVRM